MSFTVLFCAFCFNSFGFLLQDWWNSTSFANYYRTWNVVVHDWLYYYMYRDFLWVGGYLQRIKKELQCTATVFANSLHVSSICCLFQMSEKRFKPAAMLFVFTVSAVVHEYILAVCFGFFYPVLFCLFMCFGSKKSFQQCLDENADKPTNYYYFLCL